MLVIAPPPLRWPPRLRSASTVTVPSKVQPDCQASLRRPPQSPESVIAAKSGASSASAGSAGSARSPAPPEQSASASIAAQHLFNFMLPPCIFPDPNGKWRIRPKAYPCKPRGLRGAPASSRS